MNENEIPYWKPKVIKHNPLFPVLFIDNYYSSDEEKLIWKELDFYLSNHKNTFIRTEKTRDVAQFEDGNPKGIAYRVPISTMYDPEFLKCSSIFNLYNKQKTNHFKKLILDTFHNSRVFFTSNTDSTVLTYYEENDKYDCHYDNSTFTTLIWFYKQPKKFNGGDLILEESGVQLECLHNRMVIFPGYYAHEVTPVKWIDKVDEFGWGRFTITHFKWLKE
tara:strand:- start:1010 stop:1666 length:657 start_codon:yes stop_codon:yes gene_type:complete